MNRLVKFNLKDWEIHLSYQDTSLLIQLERFDNNLKQGHFNAAFYTPDYLKGCLDGTWGFPSKELKIPKPPEWLLRSIPMWIDNNLGMELEDFLKQLDL